MIKVKTFFCTSSLLCLSSLLIYIMLFFFANEVSAVQAEVRNMDSDTWEIIHIPDKPTFSPEHQPTCMLLSISLRMVSHFGFVFFLKGSFFSKLLLLVCSFVHSEGVCECNQTQVCQYYCEVCHYFFQF